jgi:lactoylglutathione lyase
VHHSAIRVRDVDASLRFWRDGLGFDVLMDHSFDGDWDTLLRVPASTLRAVFLGRADRADTGIVELVEIGDAAGAPGTAVCAEAATGFLLLSVMTDVDAVLDRLDALGLGGEPRRVEVHGVTMCTVVDPDGVVVELVDDGARANLDRLSSP